MKTGLLEFHSDIKGNSLTVNSSGHIRSKILPTTPRSLAGLFPGQHRKSPLKLKIAVASAAQGHPAGELLESRKTLMSLSPSSAWAVQIVNYLHRSVVPYRAPESTRFRYGIDRFCRNWNLNGTHMKRGRAGGENTTHCFCNF